MTPSTVFPHKIAPDAELPLVGLVARIKMEIMPQSARTHPRGRIGQFALARRENSIRIA